MYILGPTSEILSAGWNCFLASRSFLRAGWSLFLAGWSHFLAGWSHFLVAKFLDAASSMNMGASTNTLQLETANW